MAEYIERDEAIRKAIDSCIKVVGHGITQIDAVDIAEMIDSIPAADVVEVVRCKDCIHWGGVTFGNICRRWSAPLAGMKNCTQPDDFCSCGERKDGAE